MIIQSPENLNAEKRNKEKILSKLFSYPIRDATTSLLSEQKLNLRSCVLIKNPKQTFLNLFLLPCCKKKIKIRKIFRAINKISFILEESKNKNRKFAF